MVHKTYVEIMVPELVGRFLRIIHQVRKRDIRFKKKNWGEGQELVRELVNLFAN